MKECKTVILGSVGAWVDVDIYSFKIPETIIGGVDLFELEGLTSSSGYQSNFTEWRIIDTVTSALVAQGICGSRDVGRTLTRYTNTVQNSYSANNYCKIQMRKYRSGSTFTEYIYSLNLVHNKIS